MPLTVKTCLTHRNHNSLLPHQRGSHPRAICIKRTANFDDTEHFYKRMLICVLPLAVVGSSYWGFSGGIQWEIVALPHAYLYIITGCRAKTKPDLSWQNAWLNCVGVLELFILGAVYLSDMCSLYRFSHVFSAALISDGLQHSVRLSSRIKKLLTNRNTNYCTQHHEA